LKEIYIHIGLHKTASTFLQEKVFPHIPGIHYVKRSLVRKPLLDIVFLNESRIRPDALRADILAHCREGRNLISDEDLSGSPLYGYINRRAILEKLGMVFPGAKVIITLRNQKDILLSIYKHYLKNGGTLKPAQLVIGNGSEPGGPFFIDPAGYEYSMLVKELFYIFNQAGVLVLFQEDISSRPDAAMDKLASFLGITGKSIKIPHGKPTSPSLKEGLLVSLRHLNKLSFRFRKDGFGSGPAREKVLKGLNYILPFSRRSGLFNWFDDMGKSYRRDNLELEGILGHKLPPEYMTGHTP
jgi:hypothetical protein